MQTGQLKLKTGAETLYLNDVFLTNSLPVEKMQKEQAFFAELFADLI